ncbi:hypothetical protein [Halomonas sp. MES3-P3E]|uniref:hypothetical protein n=1 Tax=Halomonas sp. MES3-P3E TaxID=2058321 RepID=UPI000C335AED|nr:hypothetical protein [Halomonas sp. MES3-P3E]PKG50183.1 hypothetical protein CXF87_11935 [Halomonas sp. MES3-P3E]
MSEIPNRDTQLDRIESSISQVLDRLTRMEERQNNHAGQIEGQASQITDISARLRDVELGHAVASRLADQNNQQLSGRWAAVGAAALVLLGSLGAAVGTIVSNIFKGVS